VLAEQLAVALEVAGTPSFYSSSFINTCKRL
jgi:hypothetical protein